MSGSFQAKFESISSSARVAERQLTDELLAQLLGKRHRYKVVFIDASAPRLFLKRGV